MSTSPENVGSAKEKIKIKKSKGKNDNEERRREEVKRRKREGGGKRSEYIHEFRELNDSIAVVIQNGKYATGDH